MQTLEAKIFSFITTKCGTVKTYKSAHSCYQQMKMEIKLSILSSIRRFLPKIKCEQKN
jgi:hypothetical protein